MAEESDTGTELSQLRSRLDEINASLVSLLNERASFALRIGERKGDAAVYVPAREAAIYDAVTGLNQGPLSDDDMRAIFREIMSACRNLQRPTSVAFLGPAGTYSEEAAHRHFGSAGSYLPCDSIDDAVRAVEKGVATAAIIPVENSIEGPVGQSLDMLRSTSMPIIGEVQLPIHHQLLAQAPSLSDIRTVTAHPQALAQCRLWLRQNLPDAAQVPAASNGSAARQAAESADIAAIASASAGRLYGLPVLAPDIEDEASNMTRFLILGPDKAGPTGNDRTSILCSVRNEAGALHKLLSVFADNDVSMTKLESRPVRNEPWQYVFYIDLDGHCDDPALRTALDGLRSHAAFIKILGSYPKAR